MENNNNRVTDLVAPKTERKFDYVSFIKFVKANGGRITAGTTPVNDKLVYSVGEVFLHMKDDFKQKSLELVANAPEKLLVGISREVDADGRRGYLLVEDDPSRRRLKVIETFDFN